MCAIRPPSSSSKTAAVCKVLVKLKRNVMSSAATTVALVMSCDQLYTEISILVNLGQDDSVALLLINPDFEIGKLEVTKP